MPLVNSLLTPEEQRNCSRAGVASDDRTDREDNDLVLHLRKFSFNKTLNSLCILDTVRVRDKAGVTVISTVICLLLHLVNDTSDDLLLGSDLFSWNKPSEIINIQKRADAENAANDTGCFADSATLDVEGKVR